MSFSLNTQATNRFVCGSNPGKTKNRLQDLYRVYTSQHALPPNERHGVFREAVVTHLSEKTHTSKQGKDYQSSIAKFKQETLKLPKSPFKEDLLVLLDTLAEEAQSISSQGESVVGLSPAESVSKALHYKRTVSEITDMSDPHLQIAEEKPGAVMHTTSVFTPASPHTPPLNTTPIQTAIAELHEVKTHTDTAHNHAVVSKYIQDMRVHHPDISLHRLVTLMMEALRPRETRGPGTPLAVTEKQLAFAATVAFGGFETMEDPLPSPAQFGLIPGIPTRSRISLPETPGKTKPLVHTAIGPLLIDNQEKLGEGSSKKAKTGRTENSQYAITRMPLVDEDGDCDYGKLINGAREALYTQRLHESPNILHLHDVYCYDDGKGEHLPDGTREVIPKMAFVMDVAKDGFDFIRAKQAEVDRLYETKPVNLAAKRQFLYEQLLFLYQAGCGLRDMHTTGLAHRDFKIENTVLHNGVAKLIDFGGSIPTDILWSQDFPQNTFSLATSYPPPEHFERDSIVPAQGKQLEKTDVFAFGVELLHVLIGYHQYLPVSAGFPDFISYYFPEPQNTTREGVTAFCEKLQKDKYHFKDPLFTLAIQCVHPRPENRPDMHTVLQILERGMEDYKI